MWCTLFKLSKNKSFPNHSWRGRTAGASSRSVLRNLISFRWSHREEEIWDIGCRRLEVYLPTSGDTCRPDLISPDFPVTTESNSSGFYSRKSAKLWCLLSAVAYVDQSAWKMLLRQECNVHFGEPGRSFWRGRTQWSSSCACLKIAPSAIFRAIRLIIPAHSHRKLSDLAEWISVKILRWII